MSAWEEYNTKVEITSSFITFSTSAEEWISQIQELGWNVDEVSPPDNDGMYTAKATNLQTNRTTEVTNETPERALQSLYERISRSFAINSVGPMLPPTIASKFAAWDKSFVDRIEEVAHEYADAKVYDKKAATAWMELANDNKRRADMIRSQITVEVTDNPLPYKSFNDMIQDVINKKKLVVSQANTKHPIWNKNQVVDFRIVHDVLGHVAAGADWSWFGMNRAFGAHAPLLSVECQKALFTETLGRGAFNSYYRSMAQDKIAFLKCFDEQQSIENKPAHRETHPSQSPVPTEVPKFSSLEISVGLLDPNDGFESEVEPDELNGFMYHRILNDNGETVDPLNSSGLKELVHQLDPRWDQHSDPEYLNQAIANAFRIVLTGRGHHGEDHAKHYQAINHIPPTVGDPLHYWDTLNADRNAHNMARGFGQVGKELDVFTPSLMQAMQNINPHLIAEDLHTEVRRMLFDMRCEEENEVKSKLGPEARGNDIANEAMQRLIKRLNAITKTNIKDDQDFKMAAHIDPKLYPSPLASNIKPLANLAEHLEDLSSAAKEDLNKGGRGHHFRASTLKKDIEGIGPDEVSEAWFYLSPYTSQLGILTPSIIKSLGHKPGELHPRDYFKAERQLQSGRDASGYNHMPLGQFSHGLHNAMHHENGHHPNKSHLHPIRPTKQHHVDWNQNRQPSSKPKAPGWWTATKPQRTQTGKDWDRAEAVKHPKGSIPYKQADAAFSPALNFAPFFFHPENNQKITGQPGQGNMQHAIESLMLQDHGPQAIWNQDLDLGKEAIDSGS